MKLTQLFIVLGIVITDRLTKLWVTSALMLRAQGTLPIIQDVLHLTYTENRGAAFGIFQGQRIPFVILSSLLSAAIVYALFFYKPRRDRELDTLSRVALASVLGGALGNLVDRAFFGYVVDFVDVRAINFAIFNVADSCIVIGACLLILAQMLRWRDEQPALVDAVSGDNDDNA